MKKRKKAIKEYDKLLNEYMDKKKFVKVERKFPEGDSDISGFIIKNSKNFLLLQKEEEFRLVGFAIIPKDRFDSIRHNKPDKTIGRILKKEGIIENSYGIKYEISLSDWQDIFRSLKTLDLHVIVECEDLKRPMFIIGPIKKINKKSVSIQYYNATGVFDKKATKVDYHDITIIRFDERYINVFRKYLRVKQKKK